MWYTVNAVFEWNCAQHLPGASQLTRSRWHSFQPQLSTVSFGAKKRLNPVVMNNDQEMTSFNPMPVSPTGVSVRGVPAAA